MAGYHIKLYVAGQTGRSRQAERELRLIFSQEIPGDHALEVIDVLEEPERAEADHVLATPTVIRQHPPPVRRIIGELSDHSQVLLSLDIDEFGPVDGKEERHDERD